ncbi:hypothetical protein L6164_032227 [Bauhinia variegata]|uniref:Uncharacterized protein n=1 Tax=Bauhinia variegata TaxID=167791 RepID=A0ACB9KNH2_BAUVA|nr:hypothetical protein L6164_032227 [Bauhinia variegata]
MRMDCSASRPSLGHRRRHNQNMDLCSTSISTQACPCPRSCEEQPSSLKKRCLAAAKEQRSRFYILKRCIIMLLCWQKYEQY